MRRIESVHDLTETNVIGVLEPMVFDIDKLVMGQVAASCGDAAVQYFETAVRLAMGGEIAAVVTCPINKEAVHAAGYIGDIGHQEILARMTGSTSTATLLMTRGLKVAHLSTHKSLAQAVAYVRTPVLVEKLQLTHDSLSAWQGRRPRIAVAALNPHGGEGGMLGREEIDEIVPAVAEARNRGLDVVGPYPADSVFYRAVNGEFDAVLALYHDQGHIAIKMHNFEDSITATMGIEFIRTSVDHGTAFDIAGQNRANADSLGQALDAAIDMLSGALV
jgi:4-hydroxythreonine-4-phosphate dehydrogenase